MIDTKSINIIKDIGKSDMANNIVISDEKDRIVAGWVSVEVKDFQGDYIPVQEMEKAMYRLMDRGGGIFYAHSNKPVGKILRWEVKENPETGKPGIYVVAKIFNQYKIDDEVWERVKKGIITGFSVGGVGKSKQAMMKDESGIEKPVRILSDIELCEISLVERPANPYAKIDYVNTIAKSFDSFVKGADGNWYVLTDDDEFLLIGDEEIKKMAESQWREFINEMIKKLGLTSVKVDEVWLDKERDKVSEMVEKLYDDIADEIYGKPMSDLKPDEVFTVRRVGEIMKDFAVLAKVAGLRENWFKHGLDFDKLTRQLSFEFDHEEQILKCLLSFLDSVATAKSDDDVVTAIKKSTEEIVEIMKPRDLRPPRKWIEDCIKRIMEERGLDKESAARLCGWVFYHEMSPTKPKDEDKKEKERTRAARARKRAWLRNLVEAKKMFNEVVEMIEKGKKKDVPKSRYTDENGRFKVMTCPDDPSRKSRFCGALRYFLAQGYSLEQAKKLAGYIKTHVKGK